MAKNIEHFFVHLLTIYISSLENCLFNLFAHLLIGLYVFGVQFFKLFVYILDINPLSDK
jgi:hypothetical protein